jgi:hypothetical protein
MLSLSLPEPGAWPPPGPAHTTLVRCVLLALLVHLLAVVWLGSVPGGSARRGEGVGGSIDVVLRGSAPPNRAEPAVPPVPPAEQGPSGEAAQPRSGGAVRDEAPAPAEAPGAAREGTWAPLALPQALEPLLTLPPAATLPTPAADLPPPAVLPEARALEQRALAVPEPLREAARERMALPATPAAALPALPNLAATPALPAPAELPAERTLAPLLRAAPSPAAPGALERPRLLEPARIDAPARLPEVAPLPAPPPQAVPAEPLPLPTTAPAPAPAPAAPAADNAPASSPGPSPALARPLPPGAPDAGARVGADVATPPPVPPSAPRLNLELPRMRGGPISGLRSPGTVPVLPRPPEVKDKLASEIEKAGKADCRTAYSNMGPLAAIPLAVDAVRKDGCKW